LIVIASAWIAMVAFDQPVRERLTRLLKARRARAAHPQTPAA
jgi:hypothetical protein